MCERRCLALITLLAAVNANAAVVDIIPGSDIVQVGTDVNLEFRISGLGDGEAPSLRSFEVTIRKDPNVLELVGLSVEDPVLGNQLALGGNAFYVGLPSTPGPDFFDGLSGNAVGNLSLLESLQAPSFVFLTLQYTATGVGDADFSVIRANFEDIAGNPIAAEFNVGTLRVVPLPPSLFLFAMALLALVPRIGMVRRDWLFPHWLAVGSRRL